MTQANPDLSPRAALADFMREHGLSVAAVFIPYSQSRNAKPRGADKPWRSLNWRVSLNQTSIGGAVRQVLETDYSAGEGHAPGAKVSKAALASAPFTESRARAELVAWEIEHGYPGTFFLSSGGLPVRKPPAAPILPDPVDVFASLASDSDVLDACGFDAWASDYGYDPDSRAAEAMYRACLDSALKLRVALGDSALAAARELAWAL